MAQSKNMGNMYAHPCINELNLESTKLEIASNLVSFEMKTRLLFLTQIDIIILTHIQHYDWVDVVVWFAISHLLRQPQSQCNQTTNELPTRKEATRKQITIIIITNSNNNNHRHSRTNVLLSQDGKEGHEDEYDDDDYYYNETAAQDENGHTKPIGFEFSHNNQKTEFKANCDGHEFVFYQ